METKLLERVNKILKGFPRYWNDKGELNKPKVIEEIREYQQDLLNELLNDDLIRETYSIMVNGTYIFKQNEFIEFFRYKRYWESSYTRFSNEIGLTCEGKYLNYNSDVVLSFPFKDTVLEGGMTKEDEGMDEVYYHDIIAKEEIDNLLSPKIMTNIKRYDKEGVHKLDTFSETDNLIIKGNNLIALHTLKKRYTGKIKLIYLDPPYNTEGDSFLYNDKFNHSTWLTFMKNRIEVARQLLRDDGVLLINTDEIEQAYLKVLTNEIFGRENFIGDFIWKKRKGGGNDSRYVALDHDYVAIYAKNKDKEIHKEKWRVPYEGDYLKRYKETDETTGEKYYWDTLSRDGLQNPIVVELDCPDGSKITINSQKSKDTILKGLDDGTIRMTEGRNGWTVHHRVYQPEGGKVLRSILDDHGTNKDAKDEIEALFGDANAFSYAKPEKLISTFIQLLTKKNDIVLDFFVGSGTTAAVAHKMERKYIGIEQMDYIQDITVKRLMKVVEGEQGGISESLDWNGGGSFVYAELAEVNKRFETVIEKCTTDEQINNILEDLKESSFMNYQVVLEKLTIEDEDFNQLSLGEKKSILKQSLDKNLLYVSYSEIDDSSYDFDETDKGFNHSFYHDGSENK